MSITPEQIYHALDPLKEVDAKALDEIAKAMKNSRNRQKRAIGVFLDRINRYRLNEDSAPAESRRPSPNTGLKDLAD